MVAVDWSGNAALSGQRRHLWVAVAEEGLLVSLDNGRTRLEVIDTIVRMAEHDHDLIVGLDFAFGFPLWFLHWRGLKKVDDLWALAEAEGEQWLKVCPQPFWGRPGVGRPAAIEQLRATESGCQPVGGARPKSVFQIGGAGAVGTGSIRGMPHLARLRRSGFHVWPFDNARSPLVVEIYPRLLTGPVRKSRAADRSAYLRYCDIPASLRPRAEGSEDAFDAAISALVMAAHVDALIALRQVRDPAVLLEGAMWVPPRGQHRTSGHILAGRAVR